MRLADYDRIWHETEEEYLKAAPMSSKNKGRNEKLWNDIWQRKVDECIKKTGGLE